MEDFNFKNGNPGAVLYGNFINYYEFHPPENRISLLPHDILDIATSNNKPCLVLDVGCNAGDLTLAIYDYLTKTKGLKQCNILGIDIDPVLITRANEKNMLKDITFVCADIMKESININKEISDYLMLHNSTAFNIVFCFSITMWIHLNHGDQGLKRFLKKVSALSNFLVIEPQPWKCYRSAVKRLKLCKAEFPEFKNLKIRQNVEEEIENFIINECKLVKVNESERTKWGRKLLFFRRE